MGVEIDKRILKKTKQCVNNFECLKNEEYVCMVTKVERCIGGKVLFIDCSDRFCKYKMNYGNSTICNCPTRKEIFNKYKK